MFETINSIFGTIYDKSKSIGHKTAVIISTVGFFMILEFVFNFTYDIYISNKLSNLQTIHELKEIYKNDSVETEKLNSIESRVLNRWHYSEFLPFYNYSKSVEIETIKIKTTQSIEDRPLTLSNKDSLKFEQLFNLDKNKISSNVYAEYIQFFDSLINSKQNIIEKTEIETSKQTSNKFKLFERSKIWMFVSSNYFFIIVSILIWILPWFSKDQKKGSLFIGIFSFQVILIIIMLVAYWSAYLIPLILGNTVYNYVLNALIHLLITILAVRGIIKATDKK